MKSDKLRIIHDLEHVTDAEREQYKRDVSVHFGLDPDLNAFDYIWIFDEVTGLKKLVLYARRGTTDILRDKNGIHVKDMIQHDGPGYVSFKAMGINIAGRQEVAVGAHSIEGLRGERLAAAVSTAETRAGRRLTLKFLGLGILDASEVNMDTPLDTTKAANVELAGSPMVIPPVSLPGPVSAVAENSKLTELTVKFSEEDKAKAQEEFEKGQKALRDEAAEQLKNFGNSKKSFNEIPAPELSGNCVLGTPQPEAPAEPKVRKPRRKKNTVDISSPGQTPAPVAEPEPPQFRPLDPSQIPAPVPPQANPVVSLQAIAASTPIVPPAAPAPPSTTFTGMIPPMPPPPSPAAAYPTASFAPPPAPAVTDFPGKPSKEHEEQYRNKLREYANSVLPQAGMVPSEGIGGASVKLRIFAEKMQGKPTGQMTTDDWDEFFAFMVRFTETNGPKGLVKYINDVIGAK